VSDIKGKNKKVAQLDPALPPDDATILPALKEIIKITYKIEIDEAQQPAVEVIDEVNYITFTSGGQKLYFELFRNSSGRVGTIRFWRS
jgi:hypothetical protein